MRAREYRDARRRRLFTIGASLTLLGLVASCSAGDRVARSVTSSTVPAPVEGGLAATTSTFVGPSAGWTFSSTYEPSPRDGSWCVKLTNGGRTSSTCLSVPGVQRWMVGGAQFALTRGGPLRFDSDEVVAVDANGVAVAPVQGRTVKDDSSQTCGTAEVGAAIDAAEAAPRSAWMIVRCAPDKAAVVQFNLPDERTAFLERSGTTWRVVHVTATSTDCRTVTAIADICRSVAL